MQAPYTIQSICIFCGSGTGVNQNYIKTAIALGHFLAAHNIRLIYGGGDMGLMGAVAKGVHENKGDVIGVIPQFLLKYQKTPALIGQQIVTKTMHERKAKMYELADAFIALPGGIGTLEELVETMTWEQLDQHKKPIVLLNIDNFWAPFLALLEHMKNQQFIRQGLEVNFHIVDQIEGLKFLLHPQNHIIR